MSLTDDYAAGRERTRATRGHRGDALLRLHRFRVQSRPRDGPAMWLWLDTGHVYTEAAAHALVVAMLSEKK
jgi:hypothetical protein